MSFPDKPLQQTHIHTRATYCSDGKAQNSSSEGKKNKFDAVKKKKLGLSFSWEGEPFINKLDPNGSVSSHIKLL